MAASSDWCSGLTSHPITKLLRESNEKDSRRKLPSDSRTLIAVQGADLYIWDSHNACCLYANLRHEITKGGLPYQMLLCTHCPHFEVERLVFSPSGCHLALWGAGGLCVLELPRRWGRYAEFEGGKDQVSCKTVSIAERYFSGQNQTRLLQAIWHPGGPNSSHITVLTSDNTLSTYNILDPQQPVEVIPICVQDSLKNLSSTILPFSAALGDIAVSFDFGQPMEVEQKMRLTNEMPPRKTQTVWPVYLLKGNGDVLMAYSNPNVNATRSSKNKFPIHGPLTMHPPAEDNYGTDACSIICLESVPAVLVIATCSGKLHHCVILPTSDDQDGLQSEVSWNSSEMSLLYGSPRELSMFVFESVEIELSLTTISLQTDEVIEDDFSCPIRLEKDPGSYDRYHCSHSAGVHTIVLPWITNFTDFCSKEEYEDRLPSPQECVIEHLICTKPLPSSPPAPVLGVSVLTDHTLGPTLLVLTSDIEFIALPLSTKYRSVSPPLLSGSPSKTSVSPLRKLHLEPFENHIRALLKRNTSNPLLRSGKRTDLSQQECFQLLTRTTQVFREEYIQKQDLAREKIEKRVHILRRQKEQQQQDLQNLEHSRNILKNMAENLAEKFEDTQEKQGEILSRIKAVMKKLQSRLPVLSDAERGMQKELKTMADKLNNLKTHLQQINTKREYQQRQINQSKRSDCANPVLKQNQMTQLREVLKNESEDIAGLMKSVNQLKIDIGT